MIKKVLTAVFAVSVIVAAVLLAVKLGVAHHSNSAATPSPLPSATTGPSTTAQSAGSLESNLAALCRELETDSASISVKKNPGEHRTEIKAKVPRGKPFEYITWYLGRAADGTGYHLIDCSYSKKEQSAAMLFAPPAGANDSVRFVLAYSARYFSKTGKIAFYIEDFGSEADQTTLDYLSFGKPLTVGMVPVKAKSDWAAKIAKTYHKEIVVELAMEPLVPSYPPYKGLMIMVHHDAPKIDLFIESAAKGVPDYSGFSNLFGSRVLEDTRVTTLVLEDIKQHRGYFLDTRTTDKSVAPALAAASGVPLAAVDFHMPKKGTEKAVDTLVSSYIQYAQKMGSALVLSSPSPQLIKVLKKRMEAFEHNGIELVYVSDLTKK